MVASPPRSGDQDIAWCFKYQTTEPTPPQPDLRLCLHRVGYRVGAQRPRQLRNRSPKGFGYDFFVEGMSPPISMRPISPALMRRRFRQWFPAANLGRRSLSATGGTDGQGACALATQLH
ncbi:MAG: hypothetical protein R2932_45810 [Caldilineaceae bacterium]